MENTKKILIFEFHQETNTFNPLTTPFARFQPDCIFEGPEVFEKTVKNGGAVAGGVAAIQEAGGKVIPTVFMHSSSGGRVKDEVFTHLLERLKFYIENEEFDGIYAALHGATCTESLDDACGTLLSVLRDMVGDKIITASFDLHANITERLLENADYICGYNTYPHVDFYETGYRAAKFCMERLAGQQPYIAAAGVSMLIPPAGYTDLKGPFADLIQKGKYMVSTGQIRDFSIFPVQPWLDIPVIQSRIVAIGNDPIQTQVCASRLAKGLFDLRDEVQTPLVDIDEIINIAEKNKTGKPVILADSADSPNGGCVGDSPAVALRLQALGSKLKTCMFIVDPAAVKKAFDLGVGAKAVFSIGAGFTKGMPGPYTAEGIVRSLHDGYLPVDKNTVKYLGNSAVVSFGNLDVLLCCQGGASGNPMIFRHFGMEPLHYDLVVVKANTSFRVPYRSISELIYVADSPGAGASNLKQMPFEHLPPRMYPFDLPESCDPEPAVLY